MNKELIIEIFNKNTSGNNGVAGKRILNSDLITKVKNTVEEDIINISGSILSESGFSEYKTEIEIDTKSREVFTTFCTCTDFEKNELKKNNYSCKHIMATFYYFLQNAEFKSPTPQEKANSIYKAKGEKGDGIFRKTQNSILDLLLWDNNDKQEVKIEVYLNKIGYKNKLGVEFKIGLKTQASNKLYVLKDINQFLAYYYNKTPIKYGKDFTFDRKVHKLSNKDKELVDFIDEIKDIEIKGLGFVKKQDKLIDGKYLYPPDHLIREFFRRIKNHRVYLNEGFYYRPVDCEILEENPPVAFKLTYLNNIYDLSLNGSLPDALNKKGDVIISGTSIYLPKWEYLFRIKPYYEVFNGTNTISLSKDEESRILRNLIPELNKITPDLELSKNIREKIVFTKPTFKFYFDKENRSFSLTLKVKYDKYEFNIFEDCTEKIIYRDIKEENSVISVLKSFGFDEINHKFYLTFGDDYVYKFFKYEIEKLQEYGEVFYSQNFKGLKVINGKGIKGNISSGKHDYFELKFTLGDIPAEETTNILRAFRDNLKYYKLPSGEFIDLEELELQNFLRLVDSLNSDLEVDNNTIEFHGSKGLYLDQFMSDNEIRYIKGKTALRELKTKFKNIEKLKFTTPKTLNATLRPYQEIGFNWYKTLDYFGFGGILGDEMGLGKTLQTIAFLASNENTKSLIVAPTSLLFNWKNEFNKFAPNVKVAILNGSKEARENIISNLQDYDVLITTYNLVKNDIDKYKEIEFDYVILDEAQNIKNPTSQNAITIKSLKSKKRFALTGTPIENSLMELWSIFDFIMPGYLFDEKRFSVRYHKKLKESEEVISELNKLIKPFILRRFKKDVVLELPSKIEKKLEVELPKEQQKVYGVYSKHATELIAKKVKDDEFNKSKIEILSYITKLRQLCLDPSIVVDNYIGTNGKLEALVEILHQSIDEGHKILVFSQFTSVLTNIRERLNTEEIKHSYLDGSITSEKRMAMVEDFNEGENSVFLISLKAGGTGLNLTSADIVIHFDPWWNPAVEDQATDRAHRIGQQNVVEVIKLIAKDTIEEKIITLQDEKRELISKMLGDDLSGTEGLLALSNDDILNLFS